MASFIIAMFGNLKMYLPPHIHWVLVVAPLLFAATSKYENNFIKTMMWKYKNIFISIAIFIFSIGISAAINPLEEQELRFSISTIFKFIMLVICLFMLIMLNPRPAIMTIALRLLLMMSAFGFAVACLTDGLIILDDGRLGWFAAWPGVFWKTSIFLLPLLVWNCLRWRGGKDWFFLLLAAAIIALDGSRTAFLMEIAILTCAFAAACLHRRSEWAAITTRFVGVVAGVFLAHTVLQPLLLSAILYMEGGRLVAASMVGLLAGFAMLAWVGDRPRRPSAYVVLLVIIAGGSVLMPGPVPNEGVVGRLSEPDFTRMYMVRSALQDAVNNLPLGGGLGSTVVDVLGEPMHVHMTYLQLLADIGPIGLIAYLGFFFFVVQTWIRRRDAGEVPSAGSFLALCALAIFLANGLVTQLSNEISEWIIVLLSASILMAGSSPAPEREPS